MELPKRLQSERKRLAELRYSDNEWPRFGEQYRITFKEGFSEACNLLLPEIKKLREALIKINTAAKILANDYDEDDEYSVGLDPVVVHESTNQALASLEEFMGEKSEGK